ncbi:MULTISPECIES: phosphotransferase family protein [Nonomuraea]|uniref:Phosphotransferase family protein n=1 Tax=Nonomuraea ferruginea TaxID=46174 RepID=A0ABT4T0P1_9ACTN|nr:MULTISPECIES: phosphotransferase family protein [Nonomuraea]MDA0642695.1 phosphotransferase family protein [Nonomuraea ferruginea]TXK38827.1 phosphotransferase family protein [Nonomuraea sp. C10]
MTVPGIDRPRLFAWMGRHAPDAGEPLSVSLISGGRSNLTYLIETGERRVVLRRPPLGHVLPTAHDMAREWRVISALAPTPVPVPGPVAFCADEDVIGAPFYLMEYVEGAAVRGREELGDLPPEGTRRLSERLAEVLAAIHAVDYREAGLDGFGRPDGYLARQVERWCKQWERSKTEERPDFDRLAERLRRRVPAHSDGTLVHGDYRLDNTLVRLGPEPEIRAVVDWEMSTLGDPLADLGLTLTYWQDAGDEERAGIPVAGDVTAAPGFLNAAEFAAHYAKVSGRDTAELGFYVALGNFKLAVIVEGIHARFRQGKTVGEGFERIGGAVPTLIARAHRMLGPS